MPVRGSRPSAAGTPTSPGLDAAIAAPEDGPGHDQLIALNAALDELERAEERLARLVELRFFGGMTLEEAGGRPWACRRVRSSAIGARRVRSCMRGSAKGEARLTHDHAQRALELFDILVEMEASARMAWLAELELDDPALAEELGRMLAADARTSGVLDHQLAALAPAGIAPDPASGRANAPRSSASGHSSSPVPLGQGGMGEVWLAEREEAGFRQQVALKLLRRGLDSADSLRRFVQERRILADLSHPQIARFIDGGVSEAGVPWYAMEYVDGIPITDYAARHELDVRARVRLILEVSAAVAYAQNRLIVHRDLQALQHPGGSRGAAAPARLRHREAAGADRPGRRNRYGPARHVAGVRGARAGAGPADQHRDRRVRPRRGPVRAPDRRVAAPAHGRHARDARGPGAPGDHRAPERARAAGSEIRRHRRATLAPPNARARHRSRARPHRADRAPPRAERRYPDAAAFGDDLQRWLDGRPISAQPDSTGLPHAQVRRPAPARGAERGAIVLALVGGISAALWQAQLARAQAERAEAQLHRAEALKDFSLSLFREQDPFARGKPTPRSAAELIALGVERARNQFAGDVGQRTELLNDLGEIQTSLGELPAARAVLEQVVKEPADAFGERSVPHAAAQSNLASVLMALGDFPGALALLDRHAPTLEALAGPTRP
jgi:serine/threonine-protein kinase